MAIPSSQSIYTEATALGEIVEWSRACPLWQQDALRLLCGKEQLDAADLDALTTICKGDASSALPLDTSHVRNPVAASAVTLRALHSVQHVNALADGERLTFDKIGLTVIYGDNGSGKSGYGRVLKKICRARCPQDETILPNIYATASGQATATIEFSVNGQNRTSTWISGNPPDALLSAISVFDCRTANIHVDQTNDVAYTPLPLKVLAGLAQACQEVKQRLLSEIKAIQQQTPATIAKPDCHPGTAVGKLIGGLTGDTMPVAVEALATLTAAETARLQTLRADLAGDPTRSARQLQALKSKLDNYMIRLEGLFAALTDEHAEALKTAFRTYAAAREAAEAASATLFSGEPLTDISSAAWRELWHAARTYSETVAYRNMPFPVTTDGAHCVLCQQELSPEARRRLNRFEAFVKDESKRREEAARTSYGAALQAFHNVHIRRGELRAIMAFIRDDLDDTPLAAQLRKSAISVLWRLRHVVRHHATEPDLTAPNVAPLPLSALRTHSANFQIRITALLAESSSEERKKLLAECDELADRQWLGLVKADVLAEIDRRKRSATLQAALQDTATNRITIKSTEIAQTLVTNALRAQFAKEVDRLGVAGLAIELRQQQSSYGVPLFRVSLIKKPDARVGEVLSEGEHRCVALAAFLAELSTADSRSAIVFDDPVSSLDHMHREVVAARLADEGRQRQIIVFTHDIAFLFLLHEACQDCGTRIAFRSVNRGSELCGFCQPNPPPNAQPVEKVIESMQKHLDNCKIHHERGNQEEWYRTVRSLQEQLRTTWERAVEEALSPVIKRLANKVDTKGLPKLTAITLDDCKVMRDAYGRCSALLHSSASILNTPLPAPAVIAAEIITLREWVTSIQQRQASL